jgi:O-antigen/teichoic acid export membrane protein
MSTGLTAIRQKLGYLRLSPFPTDTEDGRAAERMRRVALAAAAALLGKVASALTVLLSVPLTIGYLGRERYGVWLTVSSLIALLSFADLGIGNGLITKIADADGRRDQGSMQVLISSAFAILCMIAGILALALTVACPHVHWAQLLSIKSGAVQAEVPKAILTLGLITFLAMPISVVVRVQSGLQQGFQVALWSMAGTVASLVALLIATRLRTGLVGLILALSGTPVLMTVVNFAWCFGVSLRRFRPRPRLAQLHPAFALLRMGFLFVVLQLSAALAFVSDNVVVANRLGPEAVAQLAIPAKLFTLVLLPITLMVGPLWPAYGEASARGDIAWIRRTLRRSTILAVLFTAGAGLVAVALGPFLIRHWSRGTVDPALGVLFALAVWTIFSAWGQSVAAFLNGTGQIMGQAICGVLMAVTAFSLKWLLIARWGVSGVVWATTISYSVIVVGPLSILIRRSLLNPMRA